ncbi:MAG TPA: putative Fe-S cluster assembly protein SufT [Gammaproteobacteria bacterium]|nr:putative Fe-S cluster assembly protein SufT [Gammaproteobacteria bacterium]
MFGNMQVVTAERDCPGILVPMGTEVIIPEGTEVQVTQAMGGSITVHIGGNLVRVDAEHADALGLDIDQGEPMPENPTDEEFEHLAWEQLKTCFDPEIPINIVDLGLIYKCEIENGKDGKRDVTVHLTLTAPGCGMGDILLDDVRNKIERIPTCGHVHAELVFDPPWGPSMMSDEARLQTGMF